MKRVFLALFAVMTFSATFLLLGNQTTEAAVQETKVHLYHIKNTDGKIRTVLSTKRNDESLLNGGWTYVKPFFKAYKYDKANNKCLGGSKIHTFTNKSTNSNEYVTGKEIVQSMKQNTAKYIYRGTEFCASRTQIAGTKRMFNLFANFNESTPHRLTYSQKERDSYINNAVKSGYNDYYKTFYVKPINIYSGYYNSDTEAQLCRIFRGMRDGKYQRAENFIDFIYSQGDVKDENIYFIPAFPVGEYYEQYVYIYGNHAYFSALGDDRWSENNVWAGPASVQYVVGNYSFNEKKWLVSEDVLYRIHQFNRSIPCSRILGN